MNDQRASSKQPPAFTFCKGGKILNYLSRPGKPRTQRHAESLLLGQGISRFLKYLIPQIVSDTGLLEWQVLWHFPPFGSSAGLGQGATLKATENPGLGSHRCVPLGKSPHISQSQHELMRPEKILPDPHEGQSKLPSFELRQHVGRGRRSIKTLI